MQEIDWMVRASRPDGSWSGQYGTMNRYRVTLGGADGSVYENVELSQKPETVPPAEGFIYTGIVEGSNHGPKFKKAQQQSDRAKASRPQQQAQPQGGGGGGSSSGYQGGGGVVGSDEERNRSIIMQVSVKSAVELLRGTQDAHVEGVLVVAEGLADGILRYAKQGQAAPPAAAPAPQAQPQGQQAPPPAQPGNGQYGGGQPAQGGGFPPNPGQGSFDQPAPAAQGGFGGGGGVPPDDDIPF